MGRRKETMEEYKYYVGGEFRQGKEKIEVINPATEEVFAKIFQASREDLDFAIEKAKIAKKEWKKVSFKERAKVLREIAKAILDNLQILAELETKEIGKPLKESLFVDVPLGADCFDYYASFLESLQEEVIQSELGIDLVKYEPYGVCGVYLPYNVPLMIFGFSCAGALAAGNSLIIKPSEYGSLSILELVKHLDKLDIPKGLINIITGHGETVGKYLAGSDTDIISFTGSRQTLKKIVAQSADNPKKIICELGGCNLTIIFSDADKERALQNILGSSFMKQGQMCIGTSLVLVEEGIYRGFVKELIEKTSKIKLGDPFNPTVGMGPLPSKEHLEDIHRRVEKLRAEGAKILCGGKPPEGRGYFYPSTIIEVRDVIYEEFFAPVILIKSFNKQEIEKIIGQNPTGLVTQIWTKDLDKANDLAKKANCGTVWINTFAQMTSQTPFGGIGESGWGRNLGKSGFFEYIQHKHIGIGFRRSPVEDWFGV
ncbi:MAG: aldehyde dehydrogenase family protein [Candidatus Omnitrophica bacterium]|nr:aldehyde dehydrogenase family protein [Candidatus Omnitrophota bacterium]